MRVVFFGTPVFAARVLDYLLKNGVDVVAVISKPDRPNGRSGSPVPTPVKETALAFNPHLPVYQPEVVSSPEFAPRLSYLSGRSFCRRRLWRNPETASPRDA